MRIQPNATTAAACLLAGIAAINALAGALGNRWAGTLASSAPRPAQVAFSASARQVLDRCRENVMMIHDVHWAAACMNNPEDDSPECTLPAARAGTLNAARDAAESLCLVEAAEAEHQAR